VYVRDPDGNLIEIAEPARLPAAATSRAPGAPGDA
jgi:hypothetical protein